MQLKVMTFNIHHGKGIDRRLNLHRIRDIIGEVKADVVGLNEVDHSFAKRSQFEHQARWLAEELGYHYIFGAAVSKPPKSKVRDTKEKAQRREYGNALLTQYPIQASQCIHFPSIRGVEKRSYIEASLAVGSNKPASLLVIVTHLSILPYARKLQLNHLCQRIEHEKSPLLLLGDFNLKPYAAGWERLSTYLKDSWQSQHEEGFTFPSYRPSYRLDYIFVSRHFAVEDSSVVTIHPIASDHLPLVTTLTLHQV